MPTLHLQQTELGPGQYRITVSSDLFTLQHTQDLDFQLAPAERIRVLLVICRPREDQDAPFRSVASQLVRGLNEDARRQVELDVLRPPTFEQLSRRLHKAKNAGQPFHLVHFDGHGLYADAEALQASLTSTPCASMPGAPAPRAFCCSKTPPRRRIASSSAAPAWAACWPKPVRRCWCSMPAARPMPIRPPTRSRPPRRRPGLRPRRPAGLPALRRAGSARYRQGPGPDRPAPGLKTPGARPWDLA